ncbi:imelysin family protein [Thauera sinica]|uniref:Imelysin family protein n=1 Tax=Thauera sinica TaxID=2665146 RepID=A0ABW1AWA2_9RHOO|nr:imelysin family protein [Thauera sp. K11]ATE61092.1 hypothetical protein CCZ27_15130 [Thauera sp. K11]
MKLRCLCIVPVLALGAACAYAAPPAPVVAPAQWMEGLARGYLQPAYADLSASSQALADAVHESCERRDAAATAQARRQWEEAALALRRVAALPLGPAMDSRLLRRVDFWPTRPAQIETTAAGFSPDAAARVGTTARGLPALEYLLFDRGRAALATDARACAYAEWVARDVADTVRPVAEAWPAWAQAVPDAGDEEQARMLTDGVNILIGSIDTLRLKYLEKPLRAKNAAPELDAWRSGRTRAHLAAYFAGVRAGLQGAGQAYGLTAVLRGRGLLELAGRVDARVAAAEGALAALPDDLASARGRAAAATAIDALGRLQAVLGNDVAGALKVSIGFGDNDGD